MVGPLALSEKIRIPVNGLVQGMFLESADLTNPVLLFLHGGPGMPEYWLTERHPVGLEQVFTVAWWEQRGAGLSYRPDLADTMTVEQLVADTLAVVDYLRGRFAVPKVYLLGHSWGSFLGLLAVDRSPQLFHAYVGMAQVTHQLVSEQESYDAMLAEYRARGDTRMVRRLVRAGRPEGVPLPGGYLALRDEAMHRLGVGTMREMSSVVTGIFLPSWTCRCYTPREKVDLWRGKRFSRQTGLWDELQGTDLRALVPSVDVPTYLLHGAHDRTVSYRLARGYAQHLQAPLVGFYTFPRSAHSPAFEEPQRAVAIMREDVLAGRATLADRDTGR